MQYILLIYDSETEWERLSPEDRRSSIVRHVDFADRMRDEGRFLYGDVLQPSTTSTCVRMEGGRAVYFDGPYAETREQIGGIYLIEAPDLDQALADAARIPNRPGEIIEVRPVLDLSSDR